MHALTLVVIAALAVFALATTSTIIEIDTITITSCPVGATHCTGHTSTLALPGGSSSTITTEDCPSTTEAATVPTSLVPALSESTASIEVPGTTVVSKTTTESVSTPTSSAAALTTEVPTSTVATPSTEIPPSSQISVTTSANTAVQSSITATSEISTSAVATPNPEIPSSASPSTASGFSNITTSFAGPTTSTSLVVVTRPPSSASATTHTSATLTPTPSVAPNVASGLKVSGMVLLVCAFGAGIFA